MEQIFDPSPTEAFASKLIRSLPGSFYFHNWQHTTEVTAAALTIADNYPLTGEDRLVLKLAALFHDTGYFRAYTGHEKESSYIARTFLAGQGSPEHRINRVISCIEATQMPQSPVDLLGEILCDADLAHFGSERYPLYAERLRKEWETWLHKTYTDDEWRLENLNVLKAHRYKTILGVQFFQAGKDKNIALLEAQG